MKKSIIVIAMLAVATTLFAETVDCESEKGKCTYEITDEFYSQECTCRDGMSVGEDSTIDDSKTLPTAEECEAELEKVCKDAGFKCENEAGYCDLDPDGHYRCACFGVAGRKSGESENFSAEGCTAVLETECGTQAATPKLVCTDEKILNDCISYEQTFADTCFEPLTDEDIAALLETSVKESGLAEDIANCCQNEVMRNIYKTKFECVEAAGTCENKECCATCDVQLGYDSYDEGEGGVDAANTEAPADDSAVPGEDFDVEESSGSKADSENKEESKSDGCLMLFI